MAYDGAFGQDAPFSAGGLMRSPFGITLPPMGRVAAYVGNGAYAYDEQPGVRNNRVTTLAAGLARCRSGYGDTVVVLPGHAESIVSASQLAFKAGTRVVCLGGPGLRPVFTFGTVVTATVPVNVADVQIYGGKWVYGIDDLDFFFTVTAEGFLLADAEIIVADGSGQAEGIISLGTGAANARILRNSMKGVAATGSDVGIVISGAVDGIQILDNYISIGTPVAVGPIHISGAATNVVIGRNFIENLTASSETAISVAAVAATGMIFNNYCSTLAGTIATDTIEFASGTASFRCYENRTSDTKNTTGIVAPAADTD